jgi:hypothetical protein
MRSTRLLRCAVATAVTAGVSLTATTAWATDTRPGLDAMKTAAHTAITNRVTAMNTAIGVVNQNANLGADQAVLVTRLQNDIADLNLLDTTIQTDTTVAAVKADAQKIFANFRIFAVVLPVTHMVVATDTVDNAAIPKLSDVATKLQTLIRNKNATGQQATLDDMKARIAAARTATDGLVTDLEAFTPAQWNADHDLLSPDRSKLRGARADLAKARQDARSIVTALRTH